MMKSPSSWLFIGLTCVLIWRLLPGGADEMDSAQRAWQQGRFSQAVDIWQAKAEAGEPRAQALMGWSHELGQGSAPDLAEAIRLYRQAAEGGDALGQYRLGEVYLRGHGVAQDLAMAFHWMDSAARNGDVPAMLKLGILHLMGVNGQVDLVQARQWLFQAAQGGNKMALRVLEELTLAEEGKSQFDFNWQPLLVGAS
ncbi:tetratricopeptide repeat protein [Aeromonas molluscorum]|uniref:tetratricopeptide repeat protein n=1 Tax=Aeromonas molluscorum TaxID=271417 RepID=UPI003F1DE4AF